MIECLTFKNLYKNFLPRRNRRNMLSFVRNISLNENPPPHWALQNLSSSIKRGERVALIGNNGCGKTTLLRLIAGILDPSQGELHVNAQPRGLFRFGVGLIPEISVTENIFLMSSFYGSSRKQTTAQLGAILAFAELESVENCVIKSLSTGQLQRLSLSIFLHNLSDLVLFDEVLTNLDQKFTHKVERAFNDLFSEDRTVLLVSHDLELLRRHCTTALWLEKGKLLQYGAISDVLDAYSKTENS